MAFKQRKDAGTSALDKVTAGYTADPKEFQYSKLEIGEGVVVRILSLHEDDTIRQPLRKAAITSAKHKDKEPLLLRVPDPGPDHSEDILDDAGTPMSECVEQDQLWVPVWALYTVDKNGTMKEEIEDLMYVKLLPGLQKDLKKLKEDVKNDYEFEVIPPYDVRIEVIKEESIKNYQIMPVTKLITSAGRGKVEKQDCPRFGVEDLEEALGKEAMQVLNDEFDDLLAHMTELSDTECLPENVRKRFFYKGKGPGANAEPEARGGGMRRGVASRAKSEDTEDEEANEETNEEEGSEEESSPARYSGGVGKRFGKKR
jgi:hypothetical protein